MKVRVRRSPPKPVVLDYSQPRTGPWNADKLYSLSQDHRRVLILEMLGWSIAKAEQIETRAEWDALKREPESVRVETWGPRPWPQATNHERFLAHLVAMADTFVTAHPVLGSAMRAVARRRSRRRPSAARPPAAISPGSNGV
jgi:hypothetical protein